MRKSKFTESQIVGILDEGEVGLPVAEICRKHGIINATWVFWDTVTGDSGGSRSRILIHCDRLFWSIEIDLGIRPESPAFCIDPVNICTGVIFERKPL